MQTNRVVEFCRFLMPPVSLVAGAICAIVAPAPSTRSLTTANGSRLDVEQIEPVYLHAFS
ncbi:hypothetical protein [Microcoleus sp. FACHB-672]|uniref:hypothetical protein n=1 Tax=Microcoleus sp. FACHB-672 TaxID=2692825 RepID=UPI001686F9DC|nr:hypothetical protein [Microcoleus sp. FACHB-672]MBD2041884.1 hypothetical protein [Microcoleus sp. FACHB-672]